MKINPLFALIVYDRSIVSSKIEKVLQVWPWKSLPYGISCAESLKMLMELWQF